MNHLYGVSEALVRGASLSTNQVNTRRALSLLSYKQVTIDLTSPVLHGVLLQRSAFKAPKDKACTELEVWLAAISTSLKARP